MKKIVFIFVMLLLAVTASAQKISYQAVVRDNQNRLVPNTPVSVAVTITYGTSTYTENLNATTNANGLMSLEIGGASGFDAIEWSNAKIKTVVTIDGGGTVEDEVDVTAVPLALYANYAVDINPGAPTIVAIYTHLNDTLGHYPTSNVLKDSATAVRSALVDTAAAIRGTIPAAQVNADWEATGGVEQILHKPDLSVYATNAHLNDTLGHYPTSNVLKDSATAVRSALVDTAAAIRSAINTQVSQLQANIDSTSQHVRSALVDTAKDIRSTVNTQVSQLQANIDSTSQHVRSALVDTAKDIRSTVNTQVLQLQANIDSTSQHVRSALVDTAKDIRSTMNTQVSQLQANIDSTSQHVRSAMVDTAKDIRSTMNTQVSQLQANIDSTSQHVRSALVDTAKDIRSTVNTQVSQLQANIDTTSQHVRGALEDTASAIRNSIGNGTLTIKNNGTSIGTFTANQTGTTEVDIIVPTNVALRDENNTFTAVNDFTGGSVTVPSNATAIPRPSTSTTCTDMHAVNVCDLLAVFDSLTKRIDALQEEVNALKSATPPTVSVTLSDIQSNSIKATATADGHGAAITSYEFCISENSDMSAASCYTSNTDIYTFTGLTAYTTYYVTAKATNLAGSSTSSVVSERTPAHAPTATFDSNIPQKPYGFQVTVTGLDFKELAEGTVRIFYKEGSNCTADEDGFTAMTPSSTLATGDDYTQIVTGLEASTAYCVMVKVSNEDSATVYGPYNATSGEAITLDIASSTTTISLCGGSSTDVEYTATPSSGDVDEYDYSWSDGTNTVTGNPATITFTTAGSITITCTATHKNDGYAIVGNKAESVSATGMAPSFNECDAGFTVTLSSLADAVKLNWGDGSADVMDFSDLTKTYSSSGVYTITATSSDGCTKTKQVAVGHATMHPCTVLEIRDNEGGTGTRIDSIKDIDGNWYAVTQIGNQCWMAENLRVTHYETESGGVFSMGNAIDANNYNRKYKAQNAPYDDVSTYGYIYSWAALLDAPGSSPSSSNGGYVPWGSTNNPSDKRGACPHGWHVPSEAEWNEMIANVSGSTNTEKVSKLVSGCTWTTSYANDLTRTYRNETGFRAFPVGGSVQMSSYYGNIDKYATFWTASATTSNPQYKSIYSNNFTTNTAGGAICFPVRCARDTMKIPSLSITSDGALPVNCAGQPAVITYTATLSDASLQDEYSYTWSIRRQSVSTPYTNFVANGNTCTVSFTKPDDNPPSEYYNYKVQCTATKGNINVYKEYDQAVKSNSNVLTGFNINVNNLTVTLTSRAGANDGYSDGISSDCAIDWGDGETQVGPASTTSSGPQHTYAADGTYDITVCNGDGCPRTRSVTVSLPVPSLTLTASPDDASVTICSNTISPALSDAHTVTYTATIDNDNIADYTLAWTINGSPYDDGAGESSVTLHWLNAGNQTVMCTATKGSTVLQESSTISVAVGEYPDFGIGNINNLTVRVDIDPGNNVASIDWGDNTSENVPNNVGDVTHNYQTAGTYTVTVLSTSGCSKTATATVAAAATITAPTGNLSASAPAGQGKINVTVSNLDFKEPGTGTVTVFYSAFTGNLNERNWQQYGSTSNPIATGETFNATLMLEEDAYFVKVVLDNGSSTEYEASGSYDVY
ncbi:MAG: hypothetical protein J5644_10035 [Bacteroidales bacterium]|nr:hypothetical protein [Bacteroidales bacterium]